MAMVSDSDTSRRDVDGTTRRHFVLRSSADVSPEARGRLHETLLFCLLSSQRRPEITRVFFSTKAVDV